MNTSRSKRNNGEWDSIETDEGPGAVKPSAEGVVRRRLGSGKRPLRTLDSVRSVTG